ncbi:hypothetical protein KCU71_g1646, partial [Aureobasidium melanogenum]
MAEEDLEIITTSLRTTSINSDSSTLEQQMHHAIVAYNQKSKASNLCLVRNCVNAISSLNLSTEQEKLNRLAHILFMEKDWGQNEDFSKQPENAPQQVGDYGWPPERLEQVLDLPQLQRDCYNPPYSEKFSTMLVEEMVKVVFKGREDETVVPHELIAFFSCVSGVFSLDYDQRGLCPFEAPVKEGSSRKEMRDHLVCDNGCLLDLEHEEQKDVAAREEMHESLERKNKAPKEATVVKNPKDTWVDLFTDDVVSRLDVLGGFQFGWSIGLYRYQPIEQWHSYYLFCRYKPDAEEEEDAPYKTKDHTYKYKDHKTDAGWAWRVVIHLESDGNEGIDYPTRIFDSIVEFLDWYGDWYERLDLEDFLEDLVEDYEFGD